MGNNPQKAQVCFLNFTTRKIKKTIRYCVNCAITRIPGQLEYKLGIQFLGQNNLSWQFNITKMILLFA